MCMNATVLNEKKAELGNTSLISHLPFSASDLLILTLSPHGRV